MRSKWLVILLFCLILCVVVVAAPLHRKAVQSFTTEENYVVDSEGDDFLRLKPSAVHGNGVFTEKDIGKGDVVFGVCEGHRAAGAWVSKGAFRGS